MVGATKIHANAWSEMPFNCRLLICDGFASARFSVESNMSFSQGYFGLTKTFA